jgi:hypothetical protein
MLGAFVGPFAWGVLRDHTGNYQAGLLSLAVTFTVAATLVLLSRTLSRSARTATSSAAVVS